MIKSFRDIIELWPSIGAFADDIGVKYVTAQVMKHRDSIDADHWVAVVDAAKKRGHAGITYELLARLRIGDVPRRPSRRASARAVA